MNFFSRLWEFVLSLFRGEEKECCPLCGLQFNEWFIDPPYGVYCYPCWKRSGIKVHRPIGSSTIGSDIEEFLP